MVGIPLEHLRAVVKIGRALDDEAQDIEWYATGFLYGDLARWLGNNQGEYNVYLVTNRHVFSGKGFKPQEVFVRANPKDQGDAQQFSLLLGSGRSQRWTQHPNSEIDIAVVPVDMATVSAQTGLWYFRSNIDAVPLAAMRTQDIREGTAVYAFGFPLQLSGGDRDHAIVRAGIIARIQDTYANQSQHIMLDMTIFQGNSGGPVTVQGQNRLIGVVQGYETNFSENTHLAYAEPIDRIKETIDHHKTQGRF